MDGFELAAAMTKRSASGSSGSSGHQRNMLEHVLQLYPEADALHVYNTTQIKKKLFVLGSESASGT
jgi:hypothetical protein